MNMTEQTAFLGLYISVGLITMDVLYGLFHIFASFSVVEHLVLIAFKRVLQCLAGTDMFKSRPTKGFQAFYGLFQWRYGQVDDATYQLISHFLTQW